MPFFRLREAIECLKRALIGADPLETSINLKLAKLHNDLEEWAEAAAYHRRVVEVCRANGRVFCLHETMYVPD
jgi:anaphase-promoting complex subunit 8